MSEIRIKQEYIDSVHVKSEVSGGDANSDSSEFGEDSKQLKKEYHKFMLEEPANYSYEKGPEDEVKKKRKRFNESADRSVSKAKVRKNHKHQSMSTKELELKDYSREGSVISKKKDWLSSNTYDEEQEEDEDEEAEEIQLKHEDPSNTLRLPSEATLNDSPNAFSALMTNFKIKYRANSTLTEYPSSEADYYSYYFADPSKRSGTTRVQNHDSDEEWNKTGSKYSKMTPEEWEQAGEELSERAAKFILKLVNFRRSKAEKIRTLDAQLNKKAKELEDRDTALKANLTKFKAKASDIVSDLDLTK